MAHPDLPLWPEQLKEVRSPCAGKAGDMSSPERTEDAEGHQEHHQGGAVAHGVHDLQLQQVPVLQKEHVSAPSPPRLALLFSASESTCFGLLESFNSDCHVVHIPRAPIHRFTTSWLWKRSWGSPDSDSNVYTSYILDLKALLEYL